MRREVREIISSFGRGGRTETLVVLDAELRRVAPDGVLPGLVLGDLRWTRVAAMASCVDGRRINTVKNVFEGPFFELEVALTMGVMKHRRKPGISSNEGQKWWRQLISKPLMWDLRGASRSLASVRTASRSEKKPPTTSSPEDDAFE